MLVTPVDVILLMNGDDRLQVRATAGSLSPFSENSYSTFQSNIFENDVMYGRNLERIVVSPCRWQAVRSWLSAITVSQEESGGLSAYTRPRGKEEVMQLRSAARSSKSDSSCTHLVVV
jgi:hypothetical protein